MKLKVVLFIGFLFVVNSFHAQKVSGKKLLKSVATLQKENKNVEGIKLIQSNFTDNGKYQTRIVIELASMQVSVKGLDSAKYSLSLIETEDIGKLESSYNEVSDKIKEGKENYEIAIALAKKHVQSSSFDAANLAYNDALQFDEGNYKVWFGLAEVQSLRRNHQEAIKLYKKASLKYYNSPQELVHTYEHLAEEYIAVRMPYQAIQVCEKAELINKMDPMITFLKGKAMYYQRDFDLAEGVLSSAILLDKGYPDAYYYRGSCYFETKKYENAINDFSKVLELGVLTQESYSQRALSYYGLGQFDKAENDFKELVKLEDKHFHAQNAVGVCQFKQEKYDSAIVSFSQAIDFVGKDSNVINIKLYQYNLALAYNRNRELDKAEVLFSRLANKNRSYPLYTIMYTQTLMDQGNYKMADTFISEALKLNSSVKEYYELSIKIAKKNGDTNKVGELVFRMKRVHGDQQNLDVKF